MALFFCWWPRCPSFLVDASSYDDAVKMATGARESHGAPSRVTAFPPNVFAADLFFDDGDGDEPDDAGPYVLEVAEHVLDLLEAVEDADGMLPSVTSGAPERCAARAVAPGADNKIVMCLCDLGHDGPHKSPGLVWVSK